MTRPEFDVWAPNAHTLTLLAGGDQFAMCEKSGGWWGLVSGRGMLETAVQLDYGYLIDDDPVPRADPRSRRQPAGVHGLSRTFDPATHNWRDQAWTGRQLAGSVIYELHIGTFTQEGTLAAATSHLDHLHDIGVDFVELLPVNAFNGSHNWGYDGVFWYAVHEPYGGPAAYQEFVDACHRHGIGVIQDVVYNHLGPSGNVLPRFGPYLSEGSRNTWGTSVNLDGEQSDEVRRYILDNAAMWLRDYHVDGLRLDAVHAMVDRRATHILEELALEVDAAAASLRRPLTLIAESDRNDPRAITTREQGGYGLAGQWSDDFHHALHVNLTGETVGYYRDFASLAALAKVLTAGYFHNGTYSSFRGRHHGRPVDTLRMPTSRFVVCSQNHDQIGNRAAGDRLAATLDHRQLAIAAVFTLLCPFTPMLFMGQEWGASSPWQFFTSHPEPELGEATAAGRLDEFARMGWDLSIVPDPQDPQTFLGSKLRWEEASERGHDDILDLYRTLGRLRREYADFTDPRFERIRVGYDEAAGWLTVHRGSTVIVANFGGAPADVPMEPLVETLVAVGDVEAGSSAIIRVGGHGCVVGLTAESAPRD